MATIHQALDRAIQHHESGQLHEAERTYREILSDVPNHPDALHLLGVVLHQLGKHEAAVESICHALSLKPNSVVFLTNLCAVYQAAGRLEEAVASCQRASQIKPDYVKAHNNLGNVLKDQGKPNEAVACFQRALYLKPEYRRAHDNLLGILNYRGDVTLRELADAHAEHEQQYGAPLRTSWRPHVNTCDCDRPLRLGFLSPDLRQHPVGFFLIGVLENLDRRAAEIVCYSDRATRDELMARFRTTAKTWWDVVGWRDERLAAQIRADGIDILFDLAGHTKGNRLLVFARKPAPIQISWIGYPGTTGLAAMDYILADRHQIPAVAESYYRERADAYVCYDPPAFAPAVSALPAEAMGRVTFGSFNNPAKINAQVIEVWANVLARVPQSHLVLKYKRMTDSWVARRFAKVFATQGVDPGRVAYLDRSPHAELLGEYRQIDIALDPFPYSGGLTTCEALWMGVPVITSPGETFASRHSLSHLSSVGVTETVARDLSDYVELAVGLANDLPRLAKWRTEMRQRMASSSLCDGPRFAGNLIRTLRTVWREWCEAGD